MPAPENDPCNYDPVPQDRSPSFSVVRLCGTERCGNRHHLWHASTKGVSSAGAKLLKESLEERQKEYDNMIAHRLAMLERQKQEEAKYDLGDVSTMSDEELLNLLAERL